MDTCLFWVKATGIMGRGWSFVEIGVSKWYDRQACIEELGILWSYNIEELASSAVMEARKDFWQEKKNQNRKTDRKYVVMLLTCFKMWRQLFWLLQCLAALITDQISFVFQAVVTEEKKVEFSPRSYKLNNRWQVKVNNKEVVGSMTIFRIVPKQNKKQKMSLGMI